MAVFLNFCIVFFTLQHFWILRAQCAVLSSSPPLITPAPAQHLQLQEHLQERAGFATCSQWTISGVGQPICDAGRTCMFQVGGSYEGCYNPSVTTSIDFQTACYNYPTTFANAGVSTALCPASAPYCGQYIFVNTNSGTYTNLGCSISRYFFRATQILAFNDGSTTSPSRSIITPISSSTTNPITDPGPITSPSVVILTSTRFASISSTSSISDPTGGGGSGTNAAVIGGAVGGVVGGIALIAGAILLFCCMRRRRDHTPKFDPGKEPGIQSPEQSAYAPPYSPPMTNQAYPGDQQYPPQYGQPMGTSEPQYAQPMAGHNNQQMGGQQHAPGMGGTRSPPPVKEQTYSPPLGSQHC